MKITEDKKIRLRPILRSSGKFKNGHDGQFMFTKCKHRISLPFSTSENSYVNIFGRGEDGVKVQAAFEEALNKKPGTMSLYDRKSKFWGSTWVELDKNEKVLDLNNPVHALQLKILKANKRLIAPTWAERLDLPSYKWAIYDEEVAVKEGNKLATKKVDAHSLLLEMGNSETRMTNVLRLLGKKVDKGADKQFLKVELAKIIEQTESAPGMPNIDSFISAASDKQTDDKIFILDAIDAKLISLSGGEYRDVEDGKLLGKSLQAVVDYYSDLSNQEEKLLKQEQIKRTN